MEIEAQVLEIIRELKGISEDSGVSIKEITTRFAEQHGEELDHKVTARIGHVVRKKLNLRTEKRHGSYVIALGENGKMTHLLEKFGMVERAGDLGDVGDVATGDTKPAEPETTLFL